jgi:iron complex transport system ATP-binding protein
MIARAALASVGLDAYAGRSYPTLSGGERQRVQLARVLAQLWGEDSGSPLGGASAGGRVLLLDEPVASLDLAHQHQTLLLARQLASLGVAVMTVLHDLNLAAQYADRVAVLQRGRLVRAGAPGYVLNPETVEMAFGVQVMIVEHPCADCPLVVPAGQSAVLESVTAVA